MTGVAELAAALYGSPAPAAPPAAPDPAAPPAAPIETPVQIELPAADAPADAEPVQADKVDPEFAALRADRMYDGIASAVPDTMFADLVGTSLEDGVEVTPEHAQAATAELKAILVDVQASPADVAGIAEALRNPMPAERAIDASVERLNGMFGDRATHALHCARRFVAMNPALGAVLERTCLGNDPRVVALVARRATALEARGRLTVRKGDAR
jgi:hypothetical protein